MAHKTFRPYDPQALVELPGDLRQYLPRDHQVFLIADLVEALDLTPITSVYEQGDGRGQPPYHPVLMTKLLLHAYGEGETSSREIMRKTYEDIGYRVLCVDQHPDFRTISDFRERHLPAFLVIMKDTVRLAKEMGQVRLEHVAQDGTKVLANASKHKAMSYDRMVKAENEFAEVVKGWLDQAEITDLGEDFRFRNRQGGELPAWVVNKAERMKKIREAKAALEQEAAAKAKEEENKPKKKAKKKDDDEEPPPPPTPEPKAQRNFTDPESRIMPTKNGFEQCYNAQAGVDAKAQVIVACEVVNTSADCPQLLAMVDQVRSNLGRKPAVCSADAGYCSELNLAGMAARHIRTYIATGRQKHGSEAATHAKNGKPGSLIAAMRDKLRRGGWRSPYRLRKQVVEPVFGQIKQAMGFRQFLLRGLAKVKAEWQLVCTAHNLLKLARATS
jgi:transposase